MSMNDVKTGVVADDAAAVVLEGPRISIGIGYLCTKPEKFRISLSVLIATVSIQC